MITSVQNPRVKAAARLRNRRGRAAQQRIVVDGTREILRALRSGVRFTECFVCGDLCQSVDAKRLQAELTSSSVDLLEVSPKVMEKLSFGDRAEGILAVAQLPRRQQLEHLVVTRDSLIAVVERIEKPGNLGAILRTADAAGVSALIVAESACDLFNPNVIRASLGAVFTLPVVTATTDECIDWLRQHEVKMYTARVDGSLAYTDVRYAVPTAIILGSEAEGLAPKWSAPDMTAISLPMRGVVDSLNVSTTAAVLFYEVQRQRSC